ncbi:MAG: transglycosylase SLT domain-containing protein [Synergistaceae bacterium]|nr:transglycosylase SLT domain-containing protein [Synergistaceae bacterium]
MLTKDAVVSAAKAAPHFIAAALPFIILSFLVLSNGPATGNSSSLDAAIRSIPPPHPTIVPNSNAGLKITTRARVGYDVSVLNAVREMGLVLDHFDSWIAQHPGTALERVRFMSVTMQQNVATTALFIRKTNPKIDEKTAWREAAAFVHFSAKYGVPSALATAVAKAESTFDPNALSSKGASGVMQVMWKFHSGLLSSNGIQPTSASNPLSDPEKAIEAGCLILSRYMRAGGSVQLAMERYYGSSSISYLRKVNRNIASIMNHHVQLTGKPQYRDI